MKLKFDSSPDVFVSYASGTISDTEHYPISAYRFFKIFAWADNLQFEIDCTITIFPLEIFKRNDNTTDHDSLKEMINTTRFDQLINTLIDGNEELRAYLLEQIHTSNSIDRSALSARLRSEIQTRFNPGRVIHI